VRNIKRLSKKSIFGRKVHNEGAKNAKLSYCIYDLYVRQLTESATIAVYFFAFLDNLIK